jgi:hypothetical protein
MVLRRGIKAAIEPSVVDRHPEAAESRAVAGDSQRRISVLIAERSGLIWADTDLLRKDKKGGLAMQCDKNDYRVINSSLSIRY